MNALPDRNVACDIRKGDFSLFGENPMFVIQFHMNNIVDTYGEDFPNEVFKLHFDNWVETYGFMFVDVALRGMGRLFGGKRMKDLF